MFNHKKVLLGITGGIAAYKSAYLVRALKQQGADVRVIMTAAATQFITPLTLQALSGHPVHTDLLDTASEHAMGHIELARWADTFIIAPATANSIAKLASGLADDLLSAVALVFNRQLWICPGMNQSMWHHPATQYNCTILKARGVNFIGPAEGEQACGEFGFGRMSEVTEILQALQPVTLLQGKHVVITAGPTREPLDPVRYISNYSSGKMGYALAQAALDAGAKVTLITGPTALTPPSQATVIQVLRAEEMYQAVMETLDDHPHCIFIGTAAVADYQIETVAAEKIKKSTTSPNLVLTLSSTPDILAAVANRQSASLVIGFAAETTNLIEHAQEKLIRKNVDMIIANHVGAGIGFDVDENEVTVITKRSQQSLQKMGKSSLARILIAIIATTLQNAEPNFNREFSYDTIDSN